MMVATAAPSCASQVHLHLYVAARNTLPDGCAQGIFHRIEIERHVEMHVQSAVIDRLD